MSAEDLAEDEARFREYQPVELVPADLDLAPVPYLLTDTSS